MLNADEPKLAMQAPGGVPAHQPVPEVPSHGHPLPFPEEAPIGPPVEIPVDVPQGPGPVFDGAFWSRPATEKMVWNGRRAERSGM